MSYDFRRGARWDEWKNMWWDMRRVTLKVILIIYPRPSKKNCSGTVGSVINRHGYGQRSRLTAKHLSEEIMVSYNGPPKFSSASYSLLRRSLYQYFKEKPIHLYKGETKGNFEVQSSNVAAIRKKKEQGLFSVTCDFRLLFNC